MRKVWEGLVLVIIFATLVNVAYAALQPFLPLVGISLAVLIVVAAALFIFRVFLARRKFW